MFNFNSINMCAFICFVVHYASGSSNSLFWSVKGMEGYIHFQFQGPASTPEQNALILGGNDRILHIIVTTGTLEGDDCTIFRKSDFIFGDATLDIDQQLLAREGQWIYILDEKRYYLPKNKRYYPLATFNQ